MNTTDSPNRNDRNFATKTLNDNDPGRRCVANSFIFYSLVLLIVLIPLPFGGARPWAHAIIGIWVAILLLISTLTPRIENLIAQHSLVTPAILFAAVVCFILVQTSLSVPLAWQHGLWREAEKYLGLSLPGAASLAPETTFAGLTKWLSYAGIFYLAFIVGIDRERARLAISIVAICGGVYAAYGLIVYWSGNHYVLWFPKWTYHGDLTGPFVNRNSFATFLGLGTLAALAMISDELDRAAAAPQHAVRQGFHAFARFVINHVWHFILLFVLLTALLLTHSRGGFLSTAVGATALFLALRHARKHSAARNSSLLIPALCFAAMAVLISGERLVDRMATSEDDANGRITIYKAALEDVSQNPLTGSGLGSFPAVFQLHRTTDFLLGDVTKAHSDYIETLSDVGIPSALCLFLTMGWLVRICLSGSLIRQRDISWACLAIGASALVAVHAAFDFSLQIPAVAATYFFLMGIAVAQSHSTRKVTSSFG